MIPEKTYRPNGLRISLFNNNGSIALRYTYKGKQIDLSLGLDWLDIPSHHKATAIAQQVHNDIFLFGNYDETKEKYKIKKSKVTAIEVKPEIKELTLKEVWEYYKKHKEVAKNTKQTTWDPIDKYIKDDFLIKDVANFCDQLADIYAKSRLEKILKSLSASINMSIKHGKYKGENYLPEIIKSLEIITQKKIRIFTQDEIRLILDAFKNDTYNNPNSAFKHSYYYHFVAIRFLTGMRPSETIALTWNDVINKNGKLWLRIDKRYTDGETKKGTKNGVDVRLFPINSQLKELIDSIPKRHDTLIFPSVKGIHINNDNFTQDNWNKIINKLFENGLIQRELPFYDIRHTFISHMARSGKIDLKTLATICGNSVPTIIKNYLAIDESLELPEFF